MSPCWRHRCGSRRARMEEVGRSIPHRGLCFCCPCPFVIFMGGTNPKTEWLGQDLKKGEHLSPALFLLL